MPHRLDAQLEFLAEIDKLKSILRQNLVGDRSRRENSAEHSWHLGVVACCLAEYAQEPVDLLVVVKTVLIHDLVEIDAGDTFSYDPSPKAAKVAREAEAANRLFALLPDDQRREWRALWQAFEDGSTAEGRFARVIDRLQPLILHDLTGGPVWKAHQVKRSQVVARVGVIETCAPALWPWVEALLERATRDGWLVDA
ncbi:MAG: HD domain-containing protein [Deltaproteobacteria bacterium]|nr:HD domain-containing protein [Deltaproteobacteria bacterium]